MAVMKLATVRIAHTTTAARREDRGFVPIDGYTTVGELLAREDWREIARAADGDALPLDGLELANPVPAPSKVVCVGLNYKSHIREMGQAVPEYPTLFAKFAETLAGPNDPLEAIAEEPQLDWEGELVVVIGKRAHRVSADRADEYIAGYTGANDISMRGWQDRSNEWLQGKMWAGSTPVGPVLVTSDEFDPTASHIRTTVNDELMQDCTTDDLVFSPCDLVAYISTVIPLNPGDLILTGTPGGVGHARKPSVYLKAGDVVEVSIDGIGALRNELVAPAA